MSPLDVRTFSMGPPPFSLPSAVSVFGPHLSPSLAIVNIRKIGRDAMPVAHVDAGTHIDRHIGGNIDRDVARARFQIGIAALAAGVHQLHGDPARAGFRRRRGHAVELDAAAACLRVNVSLGRGQAGCCRRRFRSPPDRQRRSDPRCRRRSKPSPSRCTAALRCCRRRFQSIAPCAPD